MKLFLLTLLLLFLPVAFTLWRRKSLVINDFNLQRTLPLRAILALIIVMHHLSQVVAPLNLSVVNQFGTWGGLAVGVFFFITGYGLMVSWQRKGDAYLNGFLAHRLWKLLPPFLLAMAAWQACRTFWVGKSVLDAFAGLLHGDTPLPNSWFVYAVILFYVFFFIAAKIAAKPVRVVAALWFLSTIYIVALHRMGWGEWWYNSIYAFSIGFTYALVENKVRRFIEQRPIWLLIALGVFTTAVALLMVTHHLGIDIYLANNLVPLFVVGTVYVLGMVKNRVLDFIGRISYEIYLVQGCWVNVFSFCKECWPLYFLSVYVASIFSAWLLHLFCKRMSRTANS